MPKWRRRSFGSRLNIHPTNPDGALLDIVEAKEQVDQGGFAGAGVAHNCHHLAGLDANAEIPKHPIFVLVGEPYVIEFHGARVFENGVRFDASWIFSGVSINLKMRSPADSADCSKLYFSLSS